MFQSAFDRLNIRFERVGGRVDAIYRSSRKYVHVMMAYVDRVDRLI